MNFFEAALGVAVAVALVPYKVVVKKNEDEENAKKTVSLESLTYRAEVADGVANVTVPAEGIKKVVKFVTEKCGIVREKAEVAKEKVTEKVNAVRAKRAAKKAAAEAEDTAETITIEVPVEDEAVTEA